MQKRSEAQATRWARVSEHVTARREATDRLATDAVTRDKVATGKAIDKEMFALACELAAD